MTASDTTTRGGASVWQSLKGLPGVALRPRTSTAAWVKTDSGRRVEVQASGSALNHAPLLERTSQQSSSSGGAPAAGAPQPDAPPEFGYARGWDTKYLVRQELGRGGNGIVTLVVDRQTGEEFATKSIPKVLSDPDVSNRKRKDHVSAIRREVEVMRRLRGCLNVASLEEVYEDEHHVHLVMEACRGGALHHRIGDRHYSERTVASFMRAVLRTLAQCHSHKILHRDIKPGNFLLLSADDRAPLKAIDFGLAVFYNEKELPRTDLGLEGTPWFMSPESLQSKVYPASDVWSAGVMVHQLLTGRFPFDDRMTPHNPSLSRVWKSILTEEVNFSRSYWEGISEDAKDFVGQLLHKDPAKRPTAKEALKHPWLQGPGSIERMQGRPLSLAVVQRIQRFSQASAFKRTVLELIAEELLSDAQQGGRSEESVVPITKGARPIITCAQASPLEFLYEQVNLAGDRQAVDREALAEGLARLGYRLAPEEIERLLDQLDIGGTGMVAKSQLAASQIDWRVLQEDQRERWLALVKAAFEELDLDRDGLLSIDEIVSSMRNKLPPAEVDSAVRHALQEASRRGEGSSHNGSSHGGSAHGIGGGSSQHGSVGGSVRNGLDFKHFLRMLRAGSCDSLDLYDDRLGGSYGSLGNLSLLDKSTHGGNHVGTPLQTVVELD
ncbi:hypothetical protein N2152v2_002028 [Parachlorella kessleri]